MVSRPRLASPSPPFRHCGLTNVVERQPRQGMEHVPRQCRPQLAPAGPQEIASGASPFPSLFPSRNRTLGRRQPLRTPAAHQRVSTSPDCSVTPWRGEGRSEIHNSNSLPARRFLFEVGAWQALWHYSGVVPASLMRSDAMGCDIAASLLGMSSALYLLGTIPAPHDRTLPVVVVEVVEAMEVHTTGEQIRLHLSISNWVFFLGTIRKHCMAGYHRLPSLPR